MAENVRRTILITGANGFIGRQLCLHFRALGDTVRGLVRSPQLVRDPIPGVDYHVGRLPTDIDTAAFAGAECVIHAAYTTRHRDSGEARRINEEGTQRIIRCAEEAGGATIVFISSLSAHADAQSYYGRSKFALERLFDSQRDLIVRPGLVLGRGDAGLFARMIAPVKHLPIVPLIDGGSQIVQTIGIRDLCHCLATAISREIRGVLNLASPSGILLKDLLREASVLLGKHPVWLPVPSGPLFIALGLLERVGLSLPISTENILGLKNLRFVDTTADLKTLGLTVAPPFECLRTIFSDSGDPARAR